VWWDDDAERVVLRLRCLWHVYGVLISMFEGLPICIVTTGNTSLGVHSPADVLSIGAYYDYRDGLVHWFDRYVLAETVRGWVWDEVLLVSFNGIGFDFAVVAAALSDAGDGALAGDLTTLAAQSDDFLAEVWHVTGGDYAKRTSLSALCQAHNLDHKPGNGVHTPTRWCVGRIAKVLNDCQKDVMRAKKLFEMVATPRGVSQRQSIYPGNSPRRASSATGVVMPTARNTTQILIAKALLRQFYR